ncbi:MAG TPA: adenylate/guanylate cyclase domain-containing protein [Ktedonobacteraceae bacterium]|nr:adenylate/guanylate cyclase domain-containing protein [Ktedonobacteraceae bacterium]
MPEERRLVTVLFADVVGSTSLGDLFDPEDVRTLMGRYYEHARRVVDAHGGTIEKFIGDAVMAVFGLTQAHEDDAERALVSALILRKAIADDEILGEPFQLRMGINTGEVVATSDHSSGDFLITGDTVNVAARLQQNASADEIIVSARTFDAAQSAFVFEEARLIEAKGKREPLRVYPLKCVREARIVKRPPFVGRKRDLMQLQLLEARVIEEERPQLVSIVAPAGTGKTRLLEEFLRRLDTDEGFQMAAVRCLRCLPYGQTLTYWPLRGLLDGLLAEQEISKPPVMSVFTQAGYTNEDAARLADIILTTLGVESEATTTIDRESLFAAWRLLIEAFARQTPRILIFEDLHWASDSMLDLVEYITHQHTRARLLLIVLSRPELLDRRPTWGGGRQNFTSIALQPLTTAQTGDLVQRLSTNLSDEMRQKIAERCGGNPFFALELVRGLAERGATGDGTDTLPDTVHAAVQARIDLLNRQERMVLQVASVASRGIRPAMLQAVLDEYNLRQIETALEGLISRDMLVLADGDTYTFRHILIRDVAYSTISRAERIRLHGKIAAWLEAASSAIGQLDAYAELIAYHYREAVRLARQSAIPRPMPRETERAVYFLERAGELAGRSSSFAEAREHLRDAIVLAPESEHLRLYEKLGDSLVWGDSMLEAYRSALELWHTRDQQDTLIGARLLRKRLLAYYNTNEHLEAKELDALWSEAQQFVEQARDEAESWRFRIAQLDRLLSNALLRGNISETEQSEGLLTCQAAAAFFEQQQDWAALDMTLDKWATFCLSIGAHVEAIAISQRRLAIPGITTRERGSAIQTLAVTHFLLADFAQCIAIVREALSALRPGEPMEYLAEALSTAMWAAYFSGRWDEAPSLLVALSEVWERLQLRPGADRMVFDAYMAALELAKAREDRPAIDMAASTLERILPESPGNKDFIAAVRDGEPGKFDLEHIGVGVPGLFLSFFSEAGLPPPPKLMQESVFQNDMTIRCRQIAQALLDDDNVALSSAIDDAEAHGLIVHATRMRVVLAQRTHDRSQLDRARPTLERLTDRLFLRRLQEVEAAISV